MTGRLLVPTVQACRTALAEVGMKKRRHEIFTRDISDGILGWIGLNRGVYRRGQVVNIIPNIGIRSDAIEEQIAEILDRPAHKYNPPTICTNLDHLTRDYTGWTFVSGVDIESLARRMASVVAEYGYEFFREHSSLEAIYDSMLERRYGGALDTLAYSLPVAARLLDRPDAAKEHLENGLERVGSRDDPAAERYRTFASRMNTLL